MSSFVNVNVKVSIIKGNYFNLWNLIGLIVIKAYIPYRHETYVCPKKIPEKWFSHVAHEIITVNISAWANKLTRHNLINTRGFDEPGSESWPERWTCEWYQKTTTCTSNLLKVIICKNSPFIVLRTKADRPLVITSLLKKLLLLRWRLG